jgi:hypothetical protein
MEGVEGGQKRERVSERGSGRVGEQGREGGREGERLGLEAHVHWALVHDAREEPTLHPVEGAELVVELHCGQEWRRRPF